MVLYRIAQIGEFDLFMDTPCVDTSCSKGVVRLEAQQRYFSYRAILVAIVSQKYFVLVLWGIAQLSRDTLQNGVSHRCACVKLSAKGGYRTIFGERQPPLKSIVQYGVSQR